MNPMELLDEVYHMESRFGPVGDSISFGARQLHGCAQCTIGSEIVVEVPDGTPRCTICMKHIICSEIKLDTPDGNVDAPDGTTR